LKNYVIALLSGLTVKAGTFVSTSGDLEHFSPASALSVLRDARFQRAPQHEVSC
jgi:hypothetical protein